VKILIVTRYKMHVAGLNSNFIRLMYSYLNDRKIKVKINNELLTEKLIKAGVPQGSVLEPSLFNFYTHEMPEFIQTKNKKRLLEPCSLVAKSNISNELSAFEKLMNDAMIEETVRCTNIFSYIKFWDQCY
jgi:hypothetical protein